MARKPNYNFERQERERLKREKTAARAEKKQQASDDTASQGAPEPVSDDE